MSGTLCIADGVIHVVIGSYDSVGFVYEVDRGKASLKIGAIPKEKYVNFYPAYNLIPDRVLYYYKKNNPSHYIKFFDKHFEYAELPFGQGDTVEVIEEPFEDSEMIGIKGMVTEISNNKQIATVRFFGHFYDEIPVQKLKRAKTE